MRMEFTAKQIADYLSGAIEGDETIKVNNFSKIEDGKPGTLSFLSNLKYEQYIYETKASVVLVNKDFHPEKEIKATLIRVDNAYECLAKLLTLATQAIPPKKGIENPSSIDPSVKTGKDIYVGKFTYISKNCVIGNNTQIYPQVFIGENVKIGDNCIIYPGVKIYHDCIVGNNCILQGGCVIGGDGFGFAPNENGGYDKIPQMGNVILEDNVEICANTTIDRATMGSTFIRKGVKLDNLIQVAHNVEIGENTVMAAQTGVAGSTKIGKHCMVGGQCGFAGHIHIGDNMQFGAQSGIANSANDSSTPYLGYPAIPSRNFAKSNVIFKKLPDLYKEISRLRNELDELKNRK